MVLAGPMFTPSGGRAGATEIIRVPLLARAAVIASVLPMTLLWLLRMRRAQTARVLGAEARAATLSARDRSRRFSPSWLTPTRQWGADATPATIAVYVGTLLIPAAAALALVMTVRAVARRREPLADRVRRLVALAMTGVSLYFARNQLVGLRTWSY